MRGLCWLTLPRQGFDELSELAQGLAFPRVPTFGVRADLMLFVAAALMVTSLAITRRRQAGRLDGAAP